MKTDLNALPIFRAVIDAGSFSGAARALNLPKSTVSHKVAELERDLGVSLVIRTTRRLRLTVAGARYFKSIVRSLEELKQAAAEVIEEESEPRGLLRITAPAELGKVIARPLIESFITKNPKITVELTFTDRVIDLVRENYDVAFRAGKLADSSLKARRLGVSEFQCVASPAYLKRHGTPAHPSELIPGHDALVFSTLTPDDVWEMRSDAHRASVRVSVHARLRANDLITLKELALAGKGIALLPDFAVEAAIRTGKLVRVFPEWWSERAPMHLVFPAVRFVSPKVRAFTEHVGQNLDFQRARTSSEN